MADGGGGGGGEGGEGMVNAAAAPPAAPRPSIEELASRRNTLKKDLKTVSALLKQEKKRRARIVNKTKTISTSDLSSLLEARLNAAAAAQ